MEKKELTCIGCPMGCQVTAILENGVVTQVTGNACATGDNYARKEVINPTRIVTSTVVIRGGDKTRLSVKTKSDIPKSKIRECMNEINGVRINAPVQIGDIIIADVAGTGVPVIATRNVAQLTI